MPSSDALPRKSEPLKLGDGPPCPICGKGMWFHYAHGDKPTGWSCVDHPDQTVARQPDAFVQTAFKRY